MNNSPEEREHWRTVIRAFDGYMRYHLSANHSRRMNFLSLPKESKEMYTAIGYREKLDAVDEGIRRNSEFIEEIIANPVFAEMLSDASPDAASHGHSHDSHGSHASHGGHDHAHDHGHSHSHSSSAPKPDPKRSQAESDMAQDKVRSTLRSFVRDWAAEGRPERHACYDPCLDALERYFPVAEDESVMEVLGDEGDGKLERRVRDRSKVRVLVPGCGLGRLAMEIAARGFASEGNEFSAYMLIASHFVLNNTTERNSHHIFPFLHSFSNHPTTEHHLLRRVSIPDVAPTDVLIPGLSGPFSLVAGDFEDVYGPKGWGEGEVKKRSDDDEGGEYEDGDVDQRGRWGAVVTCFFIDCARNVLKFLRIIHTLLEDDGVWINIGPLLWHFENSTTTSSDGEKSIELSLNEVKELARMVGFDIREEKMVRSTYTGMPEGMLRHEYNAAFWVATKISPSTSRK
ncbi:hypothetical protein IAT38_008000 [Cryptococcus sp. DSM 104549]